MLQTAQAEFNQDTPCIKYPNCIISTSVTIKRFWDPCMVRQHHMRYWSPFTTPIKCRHTPQGSQTVDPSVWLPFECTFTKTWATLCLLYPFFSYIENYVQQHYQQHNDADDKKAARAIAKAFQNFHGTVVLALPTAHYMNLTVRL